MHAGIIRLSLNDLPENNSKPGGGGGAASALDAFALQRVPTLLDLDTRR